MASGLEFERRPFGRRSWGPLHVVSRESSIEVTGAAGPTVTVDFNKTPKPATSEQERWGPLELGLPVLVDGEPRATAWSTGRDEFGLIKPGRIRFAGDDLDLVPPGLTLRGHLLPQRATLESDAGRLVWSPWPFGLANLHAGPLLLVAPKVAPEALPFHVALWLAGWLSFEGQL